MICRVLAMEMLQGVWKQHLRPRAVVGYGLKIFLPSPPSYVTRSPGRCLGNFLHTRRNHYINTARPLRTFAPKSSYGEIFFISPLELVHKVLTPKMKKKMGVTDFVPEKMAVEKCLNFDKSVIITRCSLLC